MTLFKIVRILILLAIFFGLAFYAQRQKLKSRSWTEPLKLTIYPINAENSPEVDEYIRELNDSVFAPIDTFMEKQSQAYNLIADHPTETRLGLVVTELPPKAPAPNAGYVYNSAIGCLKTRPIQTQTFAEYESSCFTMKPQKVKFFPILWDWIKV